MNTAGSENCRPQSVFVSLGLLGDVGGGDELPAGFVLFSLSSQSLLESNSMPSVVASIVAAKSSAQSPRLFFRVAERMMLAKIAVLLAVLWDGLTAEAGDKPVRLVGGVPAHDARILLNRLSYFTPSFGDAFLHPGGKCWTP